MVNTSIALCISTYNWPNALLLCLESVRQQSVLPDEVIIGDDGSTEETRILIKQLQVNFPVPILHVWQPDEGFKLAQIRNKSFAKVTSNYIVQIDGDLILHKNFIKDHLFFAKKNTFICGSRSLISKEATEVLLQRKVIDATIFTSTLSKKYNSFRFLPFSLFSYYFGASLNSYRYVLGANMAFWKKDIFTINGYNEAYEGWGKEDNDLAIRLCNAGIELRQVKFAAIVYHLFHKEALKLNMLENEKKLLNTINQQTIAITEGIGKYL